MGVVTVALVVIGVSSPVAAKGPESATITGPGIDEPVELMDTGDAALVGLFMEQTGLWYGTGDLPSPIEEPAGDLGSAYTLTWINSGPPGLDVEVRTIRQVIYPNAESGPVIHTPDQSSLSGWGPGVIGWFAAPGGLRNTLVELGVSISEPPAPTEALPPDTPSAAGSPGGPSRAAVWAIGVIALGLVVGLSWGLSRPLRTRGA